MQNGNLGNISSLLFLLTAALYDIGRDTQNTQPLDTQNTWHCVLTLLIKK